MDFFTDDSASGALESALRQAHRYDPKADLALAWHLRQRDPQRALGLADAAARRLPPGANGPQPLAVRLALLRAETAALAGDAEHAAERLAEARRGAEALASPTVLGMVALVATTLAELRGEPETARAHAEQAALHFGQAGDAAHFRLARAWASLALAEGGAAGDAAQPRIHGDAHAGPEWVLQTLRAARAGAAVGPQIDTLVPLVEAAEVAMRFGMVAIRIRLGLLLASGLAALGDAAAARHGAGEALALARERHWRWPEAEALALGAASALATGDALGAMADVRAALAALGPAAESIRGARLHLTAARAAAAAGETAEAVLHAQAAERLGLAHEDSATGFESRCIQARLLLEPDPQAAREAAQDALALAQAVDHAGWEFDALCLLAEANALVQGDKRAALPCLHQAHAALARLTHPHPAAAALLGDYSAALEAAGDLPGALAAARTVAGAVSAAEQEAALRKDTVTALRHQIALQQRDAVHRRRLAECEQARERELGASMQTLERLGQIGRTITGRLELGGIVQTLANALDGLLPTSYVGLATLDDGGRSLTRRAIERGQWLAERRIALDDAESLVARCARERVEILDNELAPSAGYTLIPGTSPMLATWFGPLQAGDELLGVLSVQSDRAQAYGDRERLIFATLSAHVAVAVANAREHARLVAAEDEMRRLASTDALTGVPNRRHFMAALAAEVRRARRAQRPVAVVLVDIDHFKQVNDRLGHPAGDCVLTGFARILSETKRAIDTVGRLGGEEFALLLPETDAVRAMEAAERLRTRVAHTPIACEGEAVGITMSLGVAAVVPCVLGNDDAQADADIIDGLLRAADVALYRAKKAGRNCAVASTH